MANSGFRKGDQVEFEFGLRTIRGIVTEDRGPIGIGGRRLYAVEFRPEAQSPTTSVVELPAEELRRAEHSLSA